MSFQKYLQQLLSHSTNEEANSKMIPAGVKVDFLLFILYKSCSLKQYCCCLTVLLTALNLYCSKNLTVTRVLIDILEQNEIENLFSSIPFIMTALDHTHHLVTVSCKAHHLQYAPYVLLHSKIEFC